MADPRELRCIRCDRAYPLADHHRACPHCRSEGIAANLTVHYGALPRIGRDDLPAHPNSLWRFAPFLPLPAEDAVSLGEGGTPLLRLDELELGPLHVKDESQNPTWSFKDRLATVAVSMARRGGARVVVSSSTGNAGAAVAAYAARAGLPCVVLTFQGAAGPLLTQMRAYGAMVLSLPEPGDRWTVQSAAVNRLGWFPTSPFFGPAVGSNPFGIEGYKTLAYEIAEQLGWRAPDWCVLPVCYGDALYGMAKGFDELLRLGWIERRPRLVAAEVSGSLRAALAGGEEMPPDLPRNQPTIATSIGASRGTYQALAALRRTDGCALRIEDDELRHWQRRLAERTGLFAEASSVAPFAAIERMRRDGTMVPDEVAVALLTASGMKDTAVAESWMNGVPSIRPDLEAALAALKQEYGFDG